MSGLLLQRRPSQVRCLSSRLSQVRHYALIGKPRASNEPKWTLPKTPARTRFAPSPTGYLHLGSLRTALYNYLLAQATGGQFIIRLEDTDQSRLVNDAEHVLYDDLRWAGLHWDEGPDKGGPFGPYKQSKRLDLYTQHADSLLESGHAFRCFCTKEDLDFNLQQATSSGSVAHYPGTCTHINKSESDRRAANGEPHVVRFKSAERPVSALDLVYGPYKKAEREDNFIIMKSDGFPTYHFANVVDDHFMEITHVIRGAEWLISTPKHVELYNALGWQPPNFAHVGLLVDKQRQKLSKRDMANIGIGVYRTNKVMPEALLNFSALLGWDPNLQKNTHLNKRGVMTLEEMKQNFTLKFTRGDIIVDLTKLKFFQKQLTRSLITGENPDHVTLSKQIIQPILAELKQVNENLHEHGQDRASAAEPHLRELYERIDLSDLGSSPSEDYVLQVLRAWKGPVDDPFHLVQDNLFAFFRPSKEAMCKKFHELQSNMARIMIVKSDRQTLVNADISKVLKMFTYNLARVEPADWTAEKLGDVVKGLTDSVKFYDTLEDKDKYESAGWAFMRHALINGQTGSAIVPLMLLFGQRETVHRLRAARKIATAQEELMQQAAAAQNTEHNKEEAMKLVSDGGHPQMGPRARIGYDSNVRNVHITNPLRESKAPTPTAEGPFEVYREKEEGRGEPPQEGPFKSRSPTPPPPRSPPRDPSEVNRSPQFLSLSEFKFGTRRIGLPKESEDRGPAFCDIEQLQRQHQNLQTPEKVEVAAVVESNESRWAVPKSRIPELQDGQPRSQEVGRPKVLAPPQASALVDVNSYDHAKRSEKNHNPTADKKAQKPRSVAEPGPFKPAGSGPPVDIKCHVEHLRALNGSLAIKKAAIQRLQSREKQSKEPARLQQLKATGPGPISRPLAIKEPARVPAANDQGQGSRHDYRDGEEATALSLNLGGPAMRNEVIKFGDDVWGTNLGFDSYGRRKLAAERNAREKAGEENAASLARIEQQLERQRAGWTK